MEQNKKETEKPRKGGKWRILIRVIAATLAVLMLLEVALFNASTVRFLREKYAESEYEDLADYLAEDDTYMNSSRLERMGAVLESLKTPVGYEDYAMAASIAIANVDYAKAAEHLVKCIELYDGDGAGLAELEVKLGCVYGLLDDWESACAAFEQAVASDAANTNGWLLLSESQIRLENYEKALDAVMTYRTLADLSAAQLLAVAEIQMMLGKIEDVRNTCTEALAMDDCDLAEAYYTRAQANYLLDDIQAAVADLKACMAAGNDSVDAKKMLAVCSDSLGDYGTALTYYRELIGAGETDPVIFEQAVQSAYLQDDYNTQATLAEQAIQTFGDDASVVFYKWLGVAQIELNDYSGAEENLTRYLDNAEDGGEMFYLRGLARLAQEDFSGAESDFTAVIERTEALLDESLYNRGLCRLYLENAEGAAEDFQTILDRDANPEMIALVKELLELEE